MASRDWEKLLPQLEAFNTKRLAQCHVEPLSHQLGYLSSISEAILNEGERHDNESWLTITAPNLKVEATLPVRSYIWRFCDPGSRFRQVSGSTALPPPAQ